ncbi:response regulator transcription factor [Altibacter sp.]|uniref:response regulator transcription factor n=1 Tax=Altibacter sp. TaxID=2024823 RepID=UPI000C8F2056|nr:response regulator transcription factor [Altibacter sp.]MAP53840.1 DNA-binding response regulator [Altibacter sp.]
MRRILLAEDDQDFGIMLKQYLELNKFDVQWAKDGEEALSIFETAEFDICILDVMMPKLDGFSVAKKIVQAHPEIPFLFLTARKTKEDKIKGLKLGADDYIVKPFEAEELILRLQNIIKRAKQQITSEEIKIDGLIQIGNYQFDYHNLELTRNEQTEKITAKEANVLLYLYQHRNQLIKREAILLDIWKKNDFFSGRSMDVFITRIRKRLSNDPAISIESVRGIGLEFNIKNN